MSDELKPCPMCAGDAANNSVRYSQQDDIAKLNGQEIFYGINCVVCGLNNRGLVGYKTQEDAALAWNRRASAVSEPPRELSEEQIRDAANELDQLFRQRHTIKEVEYLLRKLLRESGFRPDDPLMEWVEIDGIKYWTQQEVAHELQRLRESRPVEWPEIPSERVCDAGAEAMRDEGVTGALDWLAVVARVCCNEMRSEYIEEIAGVNTVKRNKERLIAEVKATGILDAAHVAEKG